MTLIHINLCRSVKDAVAQTSEILTYEADVQSVHKVDQEVKDTLIECIYYWNLKITNKMCAHRIKIVN